MKLACLSCAAIAAFALADASATPSATVADPAAAPPAEAAEEIGIAADGRDRMTVDAMVDGQGPYPFLLT